MPGKVNLPPSACNGPSSPACRVDPPQRLIDKSAAGVGDVDGGGGAGGGGGVVVVGGAWYAEQVARFKQGVEVRVHTSSDPRAFFSPIPSLFVPCVRRGREAAARRPTPVPKCRINSFVLVLFVSQKGDAMTAARERRAD